MLDMFEVLVKVELMLLVWNQNGDRKDVCVYRCHKKCHSVEKVRTFSEQVYNEFIQKNPNIQSELWTKISGQFFF